MAHPIPTRPQTFLHPLVHPLLLHRAAKPVVWCLCLAPLARLVVALFTQQSLDGMSNVEAKEHLRQEALKQVQQVLNGEEGRPVVADLLFNNLIVQ